MPSAETLSKKDICYPWLCRPLLKPKIWGGRRLAEVLGKSLRPGAKIGESWEVADIPQGTSSIDNGPLAGRSLTDVTSRFGPAVVGEDLPADRFPLLVKFIDASDDLSIQVHPNDDACRRHFPGEHGKHETWIVVDVQPGGRIVHGLKAGVSREEFDRRLRDGNLVECLRFVDARSGDAMHVPPGTVHALCGGVMVLEIQQPSDSTFRIHDYGRAGDDGKPRPLHLDEARKVTRFESAEPPLLQPRGTERVWGRHELIVDIPAYRVERLFVRGRVVWEVLEPAPQVLVLLDGEVRMDWNGGSLALGRGKVVLLPAVMGEVVLQPRDEACIVVASAKP